MDDSMFLLITVIIIALVFVIDKISNGIVKERNIVLNEKNNVLKLKKDLDNYSHSLLQKEHELNSRQSCLDKKEAEFNRIVSEKIQTFPYLASILSEWEYMHDTSTADLLVKKKRPAHKAADEIRQISKDKKVLAKKCRAYEHQLKMYESLFPWLEEFRELPPEEAYQYVALQDEQDEYTRVKDWLSPEEYARLSDTQKWQTALDRYVAKKNKTNWHIGIEYERYIGYKYESKGYKVYYEGALMGLEDKGRDLIIEREDDCLVVQCKRWAKDKKIHEKHIMQLFGSVAELSLNNQRNYKGVLITTTTLSDMAKHFAELLEIEFVENYEYKLHPMIKCNISQTGEKIYHLPFDQQYDRIHIDVAKGNMYAHTIVEAEQNGFRHAYRWSGTKN